MKFLLILHMQQALEVAMSGIPEADLKLGDCSMPEIMSDAIALNLNDCVQTIESQF